MTNYRLSANDYDYEEVQEFLFERHHLETFDEYAHMLNMISVSCHKIVESEGKGETELDDVARYNLQALEKLLRTCSEMMYDCDEYYRAK